MLHKYNFSNPTKRLYLNIIFSLAWYCLWNLVWIQYCTTIKRVVYFSAQVRVSVSLIWYFTFVSWARPLSFYGKTLLYLWKYFLCHIIDYFVWTVVYTLGRYCWIRWVYFALILKLWQLYFFLFFFNIFAILFKKYFK